jgi:PAS domain-containing protein
MKPRFDYLLKDRLARLREAVRQALRQKHAYLDRQQIRALRRSEALHRAVLNSLAALIVVLDRNGTIIAVNEAWSRFAAENDDPTAARTGVGVNYLDVCRRMALSGHMFAAQVLNGIQAILDGSQPSFALEYPTHFLTEKRWYSLSVSPRFPVSMLPHVSWQKMSSVCCTVPLNRAPAPSSSPMRRAISNT